MKLEVSLQALFTSVYKMGVKEFVPFDLQAISGELPQIATSTGINISIDDVELDPNTKVFVYNHKHVLLFIPDHTYQDSFEQTLINPQRGNRFHLTDCSTLTEMKRRNRYRRYYVTTNQDGYFRIYGHNNQSADVKLLVCQNCLKALNYHQTQRDFDLKEFFEHYETNFIVLPNPDEDPNNLNLFYPEDWKIISDEYRQSQHYTCEECGVNLENYKGLLHTHHKDGNKSNSFNTNLKAVCVECHSNEEGHLHMKENITPEILNLLQKLRKEQKITV